MVKISIKKEEKFLKQKQKQKQKQSQKVIVNIGKDLIKPKRRRAPRKGLEKSKALNKTNATPTQITVPQANPIYKQSESQNSMGEILRYIKESEQQKEVVKKQEKKNELEKDKKTDVKKTPTEDAQSQFSTISSQNISSLTSGTATPQYNPLSRPIDTRSLFDSLMRVADTQGENPNSGRVYLTTFQSNPLSSSPSVDSFSIIGTANSSNRSNLSSKSSSIITAPTYESSERTFSVPQSTASSVSSNQSANASLDSFTSALTDYLTDKQDQPPTIEPPIDDEPVVIEEEPPLPPPEITIEPP